MASPMEVFNTSQTAVPNPLVAAIPQSGFLGSMFENASFFRVFLTVFAMAVVYDQISYRRQKANLVGDTWKIPFVGPFLDSVKPEMHKYIKKWDSGDVSCVSVFHKFVIIASTRDISRRIFNSPTYVKPCLVPVMKKLLRKENWVFLDGKEHVDYRKGLNGLFTRQALESYLSAQQEVYDEYFADFLQACKDNDNKPQPFVYRLRQLMCAVSCRTFVGHYMSNEGVKRIADDYYNITAALDLVNFPIMLPFSRLWRGKKGADRAIEAFANCAAKSKVRMRQKGAEPESIVDRWVMQMFESERYRERIANGETVPTEEKPAQLLKMFSDYEISLTLVTFLFASQDATSSACSWLLQLVHDRPEILAQVREEASRVCPDPTKEVTFDQLEALAYTRACVKEGLRFRPPVLMVPYSVKKDFYIPEANYTAREGMMIVPSTWKSLHDPEAYPDPETFNPDRWISGTAEEQGKNWLVFGTGPHYCIGQNYAILSLTLLLHKLTREFDVEHEITPTSEEIRIFATLFPMDGLRLNFTRRTDIVAAA